MRKFLSVILIIISVFTVFVPSVYAVNESKTQAYTIEYNDTFDFSKYYKDYSISAIETEAVTSKKVVNGTVTEEFDEFVLTKETDTTVRATGIGTASVTLIKSNSGQETQQSEDIVAISFTVSPAPLTVMFLAGQSNMEGSCSKNMGFHPEDSVICPENDVFSSYAPTEVNRSSVIAGVKFTYACTKDNTKDFLPATLKTTETKSLNGKNLIYPVYALTEKGNGKTGPDSGIAYKWNKLTGEKVYIINAAWGGTKIKEWQNGGIYYNRALSFFKNAKALVNAEINAGHYVLKHTFLFWLQGEADKFTSVKDYKAAFISMNNGFRKALSTEKTAIISVRGCTGNYNDKTDLYLTAPRIIQYYITHSNSFKNTMIVSNCNEQWVSDSGVKAYFSKVYPSGKLTYPLRKNTTLSGKIPTKVSELHNDIHYSQTGHNENGISAAKGLYNWFNKLNTEPSSVVFMGEKSNIGSNISVALNDTFLLTPKVYPLASSKNVTIKISGDGLKYTEETGTVKAVKKGTYKISALNKKGKALKTVTVTVNELTAPEITSVTNTKSGVVVKWNSQKCASYYRVYRKNSNNKWVAIALTQKTTYTDTNVSSGKKYTYTVRCVGRDKATATSGYNKSGVYTYFLSKPTLSLATEKTKLTAKWDSIANCTGYKVTYTTGKTSKTVTIKNPKCKKLTVKSLKSGKTYTVTIRAYKTVGGKNYYSPKSDVKTIKIIH